MSIAGWIGLGVAAWLTLATVVALGVGRMIRAREEQVPGLVPPPARAHSREGAPQSAEGRLERYPDGS